MLVMTPPAHQRAVRPRLRLVHHEHVTVGDAGLTHGIASRSQEERCLGMLDQARSQVDALCPDVLSRAWEAGVDEGAQIFDMKRCRLDPGQADVGGKVKLLHTVVLYSIGIAPAEGAPVSPATRDSYRLFPAGALTF